VLQKVIEYLKYHDQNPPKEIRKPLLGKLEDVVDEWDVKFVDVEQDLLFKLILTANYMDIKPLLNLACAKVASMIKGKTAEEIREQYKFEI